MRDAPTPLIGQIVRYTESETATYDAIVEDVENDQAFIQYRPEHRIISSFRWVDTSTLSVPR